MEHTFESKNNSNRFVCMQAGRQASRLADWLASKQESKQANETNELRNECLERILNCFVCICMYDVHIDIEREHTRYRRMWHAMPYAVCHAMPCQSMLCYAMPCHTYISSFSSVECWNLLATKYHMKCPFKIQSISNIWGVHNPTNCALWTVWRRYFCCWYDPFVRSRRRRHSVARFARITNYLTEFILKKKENRVK